jgi:tRNA (guanine37-N1)-methyltransferase
LTSQLARELVQEQHLILLSGHYEGVDQRVRDHLVDREVSIGDYVLTNGTLAAAVLIDSVSRFIRGFLGDEKSLTEESFMTTLLGFPQYTRPPEYRGLRVPEVLLSGNHAAIAKWRREQQIEKTQQLRPDILDNGES